jgi:hypothetical protein
MSPEKRQLEALLNEKKRREAMADFMLFLNDYVWIEDKQNKRPIKLQLWPAQAAIIPYIIQTLLLIFLKTRQVGLTWIAAAYVLWCSLKYSLFLAVVISLNENHSIEFLDRVKFIMKRLPIWMVPKITKESLQQITFERENENGVTESTILSMPTIETGAESKTPNLLIIDEGHTIRTISQIFNASFPGIQQAGGQVILIANSVKSAPGWSFIRDLYRESMAGLNDFGRVFLAWWAHPGRPPGFRELMEQKGMDRADVIQHYPETEEEALSIIGGSYFGDALGRHDKTRPGIRGALVKNEASKITFEQSDRGILEVWEHPYDRVEDYDDLPWSKRYALGSDVSEGLGESYSVAHVIDRLTDQIVARMRSNRVDAHAWGDMLYDLSQYYDGALICPERTGAGQTTVKRLIELRANMYIRMKPDSVTGKVGKVYGWEETDKSKHELAGDLRHWLRAMKGVMFDAILVDECSTFIKTEAGPLDHEQGKLSDCVISAGAAVQADKFLGEGPKKATVQPKKVPPKDASEVAALEFEEIKREIIEEQEARQEGWQ